MTKETLAKIKEIEASKNGATWLKQVITNIGKTEDGKTTYAVGYIKSEEAQTNVVSGYSSLPAELVEAVVKACEEFEVKCDKDLEEL